MQPTIPQMKLALLNSNPAAIQSLGAHEAPDMKPKTYLPPDRQTGDFVPPGGARLPAGGVDMSQQPGVQMLPQALVPQAPQAPQGGPQPGMQGGLPSAQPEQPQPGGSNILSLTPQGQALSAMKPQGLARGGQPKVEDDDEEEEKAPSKRIKIDAEGPGGVKGIVVPHHMVHGRSWISKKTGKKVVVPGLLEINKARAKVYGSEHRDPLNVGQIGEIHKETLEEHFKKPLKEQLKSEVEALGRRREAKHSQHNANTLDKSEKLDTVRHEFDKEGRPHEGYASKGVAGHALYFSGHGKDSKVLERFLMSSGFLHNVLWMRPSIEIQICQHEKKHSN